MDPSGDSTATRVVIIIVLLGLPASFSSSETALTAVNKIRTRTLAKGGSKSTQWMMKLSKNQGKVLSAMLIGNNVVSLSVSSILTMLVTETFGSKAVGTATGVLALLTLIFGEITPKTMAALDAEQYSLQAGRMIHILMTVLTPLITLINWMSLIVLRVLHVDPDKRNDDITEDKLRTIMDVGHEKGVIESEEHEVTSSVFDLGDSVAKNVMVPRVDVVLISIEASYDDLIQIFREEHCTRSPVYKGTADGVVGIINIKGLPLVRDKASFYMSDYLHQPFYTSEPKKLSELVMGIRKSPDNIVIIPDEYGATMGLIILEDILGGIVDDIRDKYGEDKEEELVDLGDGQYPMEDSIRLDNLNDILDLELSSEDYDSVGGLVIDHLEHLPSQGEGVMCGNIHLVVGQVERNRIDKARLYILPGEKEEE